MNPVRRVDSSPRSLCKEHLPTELDTGIQAKQLGPLDSTANFECWRLQNND